MQDYHLPPFTPHPLLRGGHRQTILSAYLKVQHAYRAKQHEVTLEDDDRLMLHDDCPQEWSAGQRVVVMIHGLGGSHLSPYLVRLTKKFVDRGVRVFRMDMRGCGAGVSLARRIAHAGRSNDLAAALAQVTHICPQSPLTAIGFSLGANVLLKLLGEAGAAGPTNIDSAIAVAPPTDLAHCARNLRKGINRIYDRSFLRGLMRHVALRRRLAPDAFDSQINLRPSPRTLYEFDDRFVAPLGGFSGADEYYERSSSAPLLAHIETPTLIVSAADDPLIPPDTFARAAISPAVNLQITRGGGHCGFIGPAGSDPDRYWLDWRIVDAVTRLEKSVDTRPASKSAPDSAAVAGRSAVVGRSPDRPTPML